MKLESDFFFFFIFIWLVEVSLQEEFLEVNYLFKDFILLPSESEKC